MIKRITITLRDIAGSIEKELISTATPLDLYDYESEPVIVEITGGNVDLLDGYHRIAGLLAEGVDLDEEIEVISCDIPELAQLVADKEAGAAHESAIMVVQHIAK